jgi:hypothetical protein
MKKLIIAASLIFTSISVNAQQDIMLSQYMFNGLFICTAISGQGGMERQKPILLELMVL